MRIPHPRQMSAGVTEPEPEHRQFFFPTWSDLTVPDGLGSSIHPLVYTQWLPHNTFSCCICRVYAKERKCASECVHVSDCVCVREYKYVQTLQQTVSF